MIGQTGIRVTGLYLLDVLKTEKKVLYSRFYNEIPGTPEALVKGALLYLPESTYGPDEEADYLHFLDYLREAGHVMLEYAAWQLEDLGVVQITFLESRMSDGEPDYQIALTEKGERAVSHGLAFGFHDPDYAIDGHPASEWLIAFLEAGGDGETLCLREVMESGDRDGDVRITDDCKNTYRLGTSSFAWAFEVSLWHHANRGVIIPAYRSDDDEKVWSTFVKHVGLTRRPSLFEPHPLWEIPFRLADLSGDEVDDIVHVGRISTY